jgi:single-stranded DNA-binding protein
MFDLNETNLTGNLAADLTTTTVATAKGETTVTRGRIIRTNSHKDATTRQWVKSDPMAFDFEVWGKYGEALAAKARKGTAVFIEAAWVPNHYEKDDGTRIFDLRLRVNRWQIVAQPGDRPAAQPVPRASAKAGRSRKTANAAA